MKKHGKKVISLVLAFIMSITMILPVLANEEISVYLDNEQIQFDVAPLLVNGRTMVPMRAIFEKLGAVVFWDNDTRTAVANKGNVNVSISIDDTTLYKNGQAITLDVPAQLNGGRTLVPLRAVSEAFDCDVQWDGSTQTVNILSTKELSTREKAVKKLRTWISNNYNHSLDNETKDFGYIIKYGNDDFKVSYNADLSDVTVFYVIRTQVESAGITINLYDLLFTGIYACDTGISYLDGCIGGSIHSNKLELIEFSYENDNDISENFISEKIEKVANITLKAFDEFLKSNNLGLTLKDFDLDYDLSSVISSDNQTSTSTTTPSVNTQTNTTTNNNYQGEGTSSATSKITLSSFPLYLYADDGTGTFLGEISSNKYDTDSIANEYGNYGSKYQTKSIFNQYGNYGSKYSQYSVFNEYATNPPKILDKNGKVVGYLTANKYIRDAISYEEMMVLLKKFRK